MRGLASCMVKNNERNIWDGSGIFGIESGYQGRSQSQNVRYKVEVSECIVGMYGTAFEVSGINKNMVRSRESNPGDELNIYLDTYTYRYVLGEDQ